MPGPLPTPHLLLLLAASYYQKPTNHLSPWWPTAPISCSLSCLIKTVTGHGDKKVELQFITVTDLPDWALVSSRLSTQHNQNSLWEGGGSRKDGWGCATADFSCQRKTIFTCSFLSASPKTTESVQVRLRAGEEDFLAPIFVVDGFFYLSWQNQTKLCASHARKVFTPLWVQQQWQAESYVRDTEDGEHICTNTEPIWNTWIFCINLPNFSTSPLIFLKMEKRL